MLTVSKFALEFWRTLKYGQEFQNLFGVHTIRILTGMNT